MPAVVALEIVADGGDFDVAMQRPVIGGGSVSFARELAAGPDVHEVVGDDLAGAVDEPEALKRAAGEEHRVGECEGKARKLEPVANVARRGPMGEVG